jgi:archaellum component FlaC
MSYVTEAQVRILIAGVAGQFLKSHVEPIVRATVKSAYSTEMIEDLRRKVERIFSMGPQMATNRQIDQIWERLDQLGAKVQTVEASGAMQRDISKYMGENVDESIRSIQNEFSDFKESVDSLRIASESHRDGIKNIEDNVSKIEDNMVKFVTREDYTSVYQAWVRTEAMLINSKKDLCDIKQRLESLSDKVGNMVDEVDVIKAIASTVGDLSKRIEEFQSSRPLQKDECTPPPSPGSSFPDAVERTTNVVTERANVPDVDLFDYMPLVSKEAETSSPTFISKVVSVELVQPISKRRRSVKDYQPKKKSRVEPWDNLSEWLKTAPSRMDRTGVVVECDLTSEQKAKIMREYPKVRVNNRGGSTSIKIPKDLYNAMLTM